jgi:hypothetical protein
MIDNRLHLRAVVIESISGIVGFFFTLSIPYSTPAKTARERRGGCNDQPTSQSTLLDMT